jgi:hypothetical protein
VLVEQSGNDLQSATGAGGRCKRTKGLTVTPPGSAYTPRHECRCQPRRRRPSRISPIRGKLITTVRPSHAEWLPSFHRQRRREPSFSRVSYRAMETAALPLGISLTLDQVHAAALVTVLGSARLMLFAAAPNNASRGPNCTHTVLASQDVPSGPNAFAASAPSVRRCADAHAERANGRGSGFPASRVTSRRPPAQEHVPTVSRSRQF